MFNNIESRKQPNIDGTCWSKRSSKDIMIDINQTISEQFNLIRVCDPKRFPAFFYKDGVKFNITIEKNNE